MTIIPKFENINTENFQNLSPVQITVECRLTASADSPVKNVLSITCDATPTGVECTQGEASVSGRVAFKAMYEDTGGAINTLAYYSDFSEKIADDLINPLTSARSNLSVVETEILQVSPEEIKLVCVLEISLTILTREQTPALMGGEGFFSNNASINICSLLTEGKGVCEVSEEFDIKEEVVKVLLSDASVLITNANAGIDCVTVEGDITVKVNYLFATAEAQSINGFIRVLPFKYDIEMSGVMPSNKAVAEGFIKSVKVNVMVDEDKKMSVIDLACIAEFKAFAYGAATINYVDDVFSPDCRFGTTFAPVNTQCFLNSETFRKNIEGVASLDSEMPDIDRILAIGSSRLHITNSMVQNGALLVEGVTAVTVIYSSRGEEADLIKSVNVEIPFSESFNIAGLRNGDTVNLNAIIFDESAKSRKGREVEVSISLKFTASVFTPENFTVISDLEVIECGLTGKGCSMSIYCPSKNESLWDISKQLMVDPQTVQNYNPGIEYPVSEDIRIFVYRQKF